ncbi:alkaline phosphatase family protein [Candidatus Uabimicrobium amorphum]|uniref:Metalloenzyme domain-containing protein n=1 Tax=Uabimicrobium amorphum TaxID=2596890 RepID=A0A5S9IQA1_UABAM|nr:alkaline phosphatase family protein [Candidatus Uabimicrobium amorphum]BBM85481.1 hypothetical protein UABAM_03850 [Candidatus Uabimicrobium amorphum]
MNRREFMKNAALSLCALSIPVVGRKAFGADSDPIVLEKKEIAGIPKFEIPKTQLAIPQTSYCKRVVFVRYGGGVRRQETISPKTESPFFYHGLLKEGTLFSNVWIDRESITGHAQGSLYTMTGRFDNYKGQPFDVEYTPLYPTFAEYVHKGLKTTSTDCIMINNSDNMSTEFFGFSEHKDYGLAHAPILLSEWALMVRRLERNLQKATGSNRNKLLQKQKELLQQLYRAEIPSDPKTTELIDRLDKEHGERPPLGDELVAELAVRALRELKPRYLQVHLQDSDYVHWGPGQLYRRGVRRMDTALRRIWETIQSNNELRDETALVVVPDHGRNMHGSRRIPYQHHDTEDPGSHEIFAFFAGPGIPRGVRIDQSLPQIDATATMGALLGVATPYVHGKVMEGVIS